MSGYPGQPQGYGGVPTPAGAYPGAQPAGGYPPAPTGGYPGGPPAGGYQGAPAGGYPGGPPQGQPAGGYPQGGPPSSAGDVQVQWKGEVPNEDVEDNPNAAPSAPSAPPMEKMDTVPGYTNIGFGAGSMLPPPSYDEAMRQPPPERQQVQNTQTLTEEDARQALLEMVAENCCYGKGAAQDMRFNDMKHSSAFHYTLETFGESRSTAWAYEPYRGQPIDGPQNGPAPGPWDIQMQPNKVFENQKMAVEVPHTASVKPCHTCYAMGKVRCHRCYGRGRVRCTWCHGRGHRTEFRDGRHEHVHCTWCHGNGRRRCDTCHGFGMVTCPGCQGTCNLKCYIQLSIHWTNHLNDHIVERTALPDHLIRGVTGKVAFEETSIRVWPVNHFPDSEINTASQRLVNQHSTAFPNERLLMQRHRVRIIPVAQAFYTWKNEQSDFFVYGFEKRVYAPNYPQQCCCGCEIL